MNIGMLSMDYPPRMAGGTTIHTYQMAQQFAKLEHRPYVIAASHPSAVREEHGEVEVRRVGRPYTLTSAFKARSMRSDMDIVHGHGTCAYGFMKLCKFPTVIKMHSTWQEEYDHYRQLGRSTGLMRWYIRMDKYCANRADAVIAISNVIKHETMKYGVPAEKITVVHNGINAEPFKKAKARRKELKIGDEIVIGYIGRLAPHKGVLAMAKAFKELSTKYDDILFMAVGSGPEKTKMEEILAKLKTRVRFIDYVPHEFVPDYYATADIIVYPTLYEPLGNVVLESMAAGRPLIASKTGGIPEIFSSSCGLMIPPPVNNDPANLISALEELISSGTKRTRMGVAGKTTVKKFSWYKVCKQTLDIMENVLHV